MPLSTYSQAAGDVARRVGDFASGLISPTVKLGVTGLARSGKTVFIMALVHNLMAGARLPFFDAAAQGRLVRAYLEPQPDAFVARFPFEKHLADLKNRTLFWVHTFEWISVVATSLICSVVIWSLMIKRRLYRDVGTTRLGQAID